MTLQGSTERLPAKVNPGGLSSADARVRFARQGPNEVDTGRGFWPIRTLVGLLLNPLVLILIATSIISGLLGELTNTTIIVLMVVLSMALDFFQVYRSESAASKLRALVQPTVVAWRDGNRVEIPVRELVVDDVIELRAGDLVPADGLLTSASTLSLDEAALTGESLPADKRSGDAVYAGTSVVSGLGQAAVTATGAATQFGAIARSLIERAPPTEFELGIRRFGYLILRTVLGLVFFVLLVNAILGRDYLESFLFALALAVGLTPEFLPMIITVTLGQGALRLSRQKVIVKRLSAIENLGSMDVLCSDKTGTLTRGVVELQRHVDFSGKESEEVLRWLCINSALESGVRSHLDDAILAHEHPSVNDFSKLAELPLDFERRRVSVLAVGPRGVELIAKGAPEGMLPLCLQVDTANGPIPLDDELRRVAVETFEQLSRSGFHVLAAARKTMASDCRAITPEDEEGLILVGFAAFLDPPDPSAKQTLLNLQEKGVRTIVLTGDGELIARTVCEQVGLHTKEVVLGDELTRMSDDALAAVVERTEIFARVSPSQKNRVIRALRRNKHVVGYIGDGINDAPSLHIADVGISVSNGVEVAKEAADIILLEKSLAAVHRGVIEGRSSCGNISKYVLMGTSSNFGNMLSMAVASAFLPFLPLLPAQILLNNFLYDLSQVPIPTDNVDPEYTARPRKWDPALIQRFMFTLGPISSLYDFVTFGVLLWVFRAGPEVFRAGWFIESLVTQILVILVIRTERNPFRSRPSRPLVIGIVGSLLAGLLIVVTPIGGHLGFGTLPLSFFAVLIIMTATYLTLVELLKRRVMATVY